MGADDFKLKKATSTEEIAYQAASQSVHINTPYVPPQMVQRTEDKSRHISVSKVRQSDPQEKRGGGGKEGCVDSSRRCWEY